MVFALKPTSFLLGTVTGTFLLFTFSVKDFTKLRRKKIARGGLKTEFYRQTEPGPTQNYACCRICHPTFRISYRVPAKLMGGQEDISRYMFFKTKRPSKRQVQHPEVLKMMSSYLFAEQMKKAVHFRQKLTFQENRLK